MKNLGPQYFTYQLYLRPRPGSWYYIPPGWFYPCHQGICWALCLRQVLSFIVGGWLPSPYLSLGFIATQCLPFLLGVFHHCSGLVLTSFNSDHLCRANLSPLDWIKLISLPSHGFWIPYIFCLPTSQVREAVKVRGLDVWMETMSELLRAELQGRFSDWLDAGERMEGEEMLSRFLAWTSGQRYVLCKNHWPPIQH